MVELFNQNHYAVSLFMMFCFCILILNICSLFHKSVQKNKILIVALALYCGIMSFMTVVCTATAFSFFNQLSLPPVCKWLMDKTILLLVVVLTNVVLLIFISVKEYYYRKNYISLLAVKESFDNLPTGLCFAKNNGMILLVNYKMIELCYNMFGIYIQNADEFWDMLSAGKTLEGAELISDGEQPQYRLSDSTIWSFKKEKIESVVQLSASDVTEFYELTNQIEKKNEELSRMNARLVKYGETVDETTRVRERLETKIRIHSEFGQTLLATRYCLYQKDADFQPIFNAWKRNIAVLRTQAEPSKNKELLQSLVEIANSAGVRVEINGAIPKTDLVVELMTSAATEALTNAVRHAQATVLHLDFCETDEHFYAKYTNDGLTPAGDIREGGGLGSLRSKIERFGGEMEIKSSPQFILIVKLPKEVNRYV